MQAYFDFLRFSLNDEMPLPSSAHNIDYERLLAFAQRQTLVGVYFCGIKKLPRELCPPQSTLIKWVMAAEAIRRNNIKTIEATQKLQTFCSEKGFDSVILKGQSNALLYPTPWSRASGDIDIWLAPKNKEYNKATPSTVLNFAKKELGGTKPFYHNVIVHNFDNICVEVHYRPSFLHNPFNNHRLQKWFVKNAQQQFGLPKQVEIEGKAYGFAPPRTEFDIVFQLCHITHHFFYLGIGMRQFVDYHLLLQSNKTNADKAYWYQLLNKLGLYKAAQAVMWVLSYTLKTDERKMIAQPNEKLGSLLLNEIIASGNFGFYDNRISHWQRHTAFGHHLQRFVRDLRFCINFPSETLWEPAFRLWHFLWRLRHR